MKNIVAVDLFCGIGGLTHGLVTEGINVVAGYDVDESCRYAFEANNNSRFIKKSVAEIEKGEIDELFHGAGIKLLVGCAPCQPFSAQTLRKNKKDERWGLLNDFLRIIEFSEPDVVSMENVPNLSKQDIYLNFESSLKRMGYHVSASKVFSPNYGIPQKRKRLVLLASKLGHISIIKPMYAREDYKTVEGTIGHLNPLAAGERDASDPLHSCNPLTEINLRRVRNSKEGGSWDDWDDELKLPCHKRLRVKMFKGVYGRMNRKEPAPTLTTYCLKVNSGRFVHYSQDRGLSVREAALIQTFPEYYKHYNQECPRPSNVVLSRQIGNAVPVELGRVIAKSIKKHLTDNEVMV